jgi:hypothetical protein
MHPGAKHRSLWPCPQSFPRQTALSVSGKSASSMAIFCGPSASWMTMTDASAGKPNCSVKSKLRVSVTPPNLGV